MFLFLLLGFLLYVVKGKDVVGSKAYNLLINTTVSHDWEHVFDLTPAGKVGSDQSALIVCGTFFPDSCLELNKTNADILPFTEDIVSFFLSTSPMGYLEYWLKHYPGIASNFHYLAVMKKEDCVNYYSVIAVVVSKDSKRIILMNYDLPDRDVVKWIKKAIG